MSAHFFFFEIWLTSKLYKAKKYSENGYNDKKTYKKTQH